MTGSWKNLIPLLLILCTIRCNAGENPSAAFVDGGEYMRYKLRFSIFQVGVATVSCEEDRTGNIYHIRAEARSDGLMRRFNNMHYLLESSVDPLTGLPDSAIISLNDRKNSFYNELVFYQEARPDSALVKSLLSGIHVVTRDIYEILTGFYHFRYHLINVDQKHTPDLVIKTFYPDKRWDLRFRYAGEERIRTVMGPEDCFKYHPNTIAGKFFIHEDDMSVWFTKDKPHIPVKFRLDLRIGAIQGVLVEYSNPE